MKKRILLSLVSFFAMTAMWASLIDAYKITVTAPNGKTNSTAVLTLSMDNRNAIGTWSCTLVLPEGVTYVEGSATVSGSRYPEGYEANLTATPSNDNEVRLFCEGTPGVALTGTAGEIATVTVEIAADAPVGDCIISVKDAVLTEVNDTEHNQDLKEFTWTIEQGEEPGVDGDLNGDGKTDIADAVMVLSKMAAGVYDPQADFNEDEKVDIADFVMVLTIMASQSGQ